MSKTNDLELNHNKSAAASQAHFSGLPTKPNVIRVKIDRRMQRPVQQRNPYHAQSSRECGARGVVRGRLRHACLRVSFLTLDGLPLESSQITVDEIEKVK